MAAAEARGFDDIRHSRTKIDRSIDGDRDFDRDSRASRGCEGGGRIHARNFEYEWANIGWEDIFLERFQSMHHLYIQLVSSAVFFASLKFQPL